ncbi:hypothetical protein A9Q83_03640 [Alphaproteobacteria bacterium 46_93_T64]|nr:hypothetical protein A9Q83_03640 [Alphaproteobacteria bacterium 46_93_T64]
MLNQGGLNKQRNRNIRWTRQASSGERTFSVQHTVAAKAALIPEISVADEMRRWSVSPSDFDQLLYGLKKTECSD